MESYQNRPGADSLFTTYAQNGEKIVPKSELLEAQQYILKCSYHKAGEIANFLFSQKRFEEAVQVYQKIIEREQNNNQEIEGLGCSELAISRYEWFVYEWYERQKKQGLLQENPYDALGLCLVSLKLKGQKKYLVSSVEWFQDMLGLRTDYRLILGYANNLYMLDRFDEAIKEYKRVIQLRPNLINAYASLALLYEYKRVEKPKSIALAKKILELSPFNAYAQYILGRNEKKVDQKIQYLIISSQRHPDYIRIVNEIGIAYGSAKKIYKQAISWYKKCIEKVPQYTACYNNIGVNHQLLKDYHEALKWYFQCCQYDNEYRSAYDNLIDVFDSLKYTNEQIIQEYQKHPSIDRFKFYLNLGTSLNRKSRYQDSLNWLQKAKQLNDTNVTVYNTFGMNYDDLKMYQQSQVNYLKCIQLDPTFYQSYYNLAIAHKNRSNTDKAIYYYEKSIEVNPKYSYAYNNLGNIYKAKQMYEKALEYYRQAVQHLSTYTLAFVNMAVCYERLENYTEAHRYFKRAKEVLPTDNNNLSESNKTFINDSINRFEKQGKEWRKSGKLSKNQKVKLDQFIQRYFKKVGQFYMGRNLSAVSNEIALRTQVLDIVKLISEDQFSLKLIDKIFQNVKKAFFKNEQYFQIIPLIFIQYFYKQKFEENKDILQIERSLKNIINNLSRFQKNEETIRAEEQLILNFKLKNFNPSQAADINLFKQNAIFDSYDSLYTQINRVNQAASQSIVDFKELVNAISKRSNAIHNGVSMKLPSNYDQEFLVILRILKYMFKDQISKQKEDQIISKIDHVLSSKEQVNLKIVTNEIKEAWSKQISQILDKRRNKNIQTKFAVGDLLKCKIHTTSPHKMIKTLQSCNNLCSIKGYDIIEMYRQQKAHLAFKVILKIKIRQAICEVAICLNQDENRQRFFEDIDQIQQNPLGVIFGSYLYLTNKFSYPFYSNCKDIEKYFEQNGKQSDKSLKQSSSYIIKQFERAQKFGQFLR